MAVVVTNSQLCSMRGLTVDQRVLEYMLEKKMPKVHKQALDLGFPLSVITTRWHMCVFLNSLPTEVRGKLHYYSAAASTIAIVARQTLYSSRWCGVRFAGCSRCFACGIASCSKAASLCSLSAFGSSR